MAFSVTGSITIADVRDGEPGDAAPHFAERKLYTNPAVTSIPSAPNATITWSTGALSNITAGWSETPPTQVPSSSSDVYESTLIFADTTPPFTTSVATGSSPRIGINFSGLVTFNAGDFEVDGSTITNIDGGNITTGTITAKQLELSGSGDSFVGEWTHYPLGHFSMPNGTVALYEDTGLSIIPSTGDSLDVIRKFMIKDIDGDSRSFSSLFDSMESADATGGKVTIIALNTSGTIKCRQDFEVTKVVTYGYTPSSTRNQAVFEVTPSGPGYGTFTDSDPYKFVFTPNAAASLRVGTIVADDTTAVPTSGSGAYISSNGNASFGSTDAYIAWSEANQELKVAADIESDNFTNSQVIVLDQTMTTKITDTIDTATYSVGDWSLQDDWRFPTYPATYPSTWDGWVDNYLYIDHDSFDSLPGSGAVEVTFDASNKVTFMYIKQSTYSFQENVLNINPLRLLSIASGTELGVPSTTSQTPTVKVFTYDPTLLEGFRLGRAGDSVFEDVTTFRLNDWQLPGQGKFNFVYTDTEGYRGNGSGHHVVIGRGAGAVTTYSGTYDVNTYGNICIGENAGGGDHDNVVIGGGALMDSAFAAGNVAVGSRALSNLTGNTGPYDGNVAIGRSALSDTQYGDLNVAIGTYAGGDDVLGNWSHTTDPISVSNGYDAVGSVGAGNWQLVRNEMSGEVESDPITDFDDWEGVTFVFRPDTSNPISDAYTGWHEIAKGAVGGQNEIDMRIEATSDSSKFIEFTTKIGYIKNEGGYVLDVYIPRGSVSSYGTAFTSSDALTVSLLDDIFLRAPGGSFNTFLGAQSSSAYPRYNERISTAQGDATFASRDTGALADNTWDFRDTSGTSVTPTEWYDLVGKRLYFNSATTNSQTEMSRAVENRTIRLGFNSWTQYATFYVDAGSTLPDGGGDEYITLGDLVARTYTPQLSGQLSVQVNSGRGHYNTFVGCDASLEPSPAQIEDNMIVLGRNTSKIYSDTTGISSLSDERDKIDFTELTYGLDAVNSITPYRYRRNPRKSYLEMNDDETWTFDAAAHEAGDKKKHRFEYGFKAQDFGAAVGYGDEIVEIDYRDDYDMEFQRFNMIQSVPILWKAVQELSAKVDELQAEIDTLKQ